jgi:hypothetical protein
VQSDDSKWFKGVFRSLDKKKRTYAVEVYLGIESDFASASLQMPQPSARVRLKVNRVNSLRPTKENTAILEGVVVFDALSSQASFICVVSVKGKSLHIADNIGEYSMFVTYIADDVPHTRIINGIAAIQRAIDKGADASRRFSPDPRRTVLNCRDKAPNTDILKQRTSRADIAKFKTAIANIKPLSNESQLRAAVKSCTSDSGNVVIVGPPGTGKTDTSEKIGHGQATLGRRIMYTAPINSNVKTLVDEFLNYNAKLRPEKQYKDSEWVYFTRGHSSIDKAGKLREEQLAGEDLLNHANKKIFAYLNDAKNQAHIPRYEQTLGYKVRQQINVYAADPKFNKAPFEEHKLHTNTKSYLETVDMLPFLEVKDEKTQAKAHIQALKYGFTVHFLQCVKFLFCTLSTSSHDLIAESSN